jgi:hypothetical protein
MNTGARRAHGQFDAAWHGNVLIATFRGVWNQESVYVLFAEVERRLAEPGAPKRWGALADMRDWQGATPEAMDEYEAGQPRLVAAGLTVVARVFVEGFFNKMIETRVRESERIPVLVTDNIDQAFAWLASHGFAKKEDTP